MKSVPLGGIFSLLVFACSEKEPVDRISDVLGLEKVAEVASQIHRKK